MSSDKALSGVLSLLGGDTPLPHVRYTFSSSAEPGVPWHVRRVHTREALSELYEVAIDLVFDGPFVDADALLGSSCTLRLERVHLSREVQGIARHVEDLGTLVDKRMVRVHLVPALWELSQRIDSYIFQEMTVPQVLEDVLNEGLLPLKRKVNLSALHRDYPKREYCVQYAESDLDFVLRLMKEEGIAFYFDHSGEAEELVLVEDNAPFPACQTLDNGPVWIANQAGGLARMETLQGLEWSTSLRQTGVVVRDFDWTNPGFSLTKDARAKEESGREAYLYPAELTLSAYDDKKQFRYTKEDAAVRTHLLREGQQLGQKKGRGRGNVTSFRPGSTFQLQGHGRPELDQAYLITRVEHLGEAPEVHPLFSQESSSEEIKPERYENCFECIPLSVPFRPEYPLVRSRIPGLQTALVVGPEGEEIHTDPHGRIKVRFHWDRVGPQNDKASCWVRVAQAWGGAGFGAYYIPRVGMEVVIDFLEGNPDRPLVIGCVYNGSNPPPLTLPEQRTRTTLRSQSSPGGGGYNELRFEDAKDNEQVFLHAQKDMSAVVEHDDSTQVKNDQTNTVDANQTESVGGNQSMTVSGNRTKTVKQNETVTVEQNRTETVNVNETVTVHGERSLTVDGKETYSIGGTRAKTVTGKETVTLAAGRQTTVTTNDELHVSDQRLVTADMKHQTIQGPTTFTFEGGHVELKAGSYIKLIHGTGQVLIEDSGKVLVNSGTEIELTCGGCSIKLTPTKVEIHGAAEVFLSGGAGNMKLDSSGAATSGPNISSSAGVLNEVSGAVVKIN